MVRRHSVADVPLGKNRNTPVLVHCGAGVGRTGVTIACDVLLTSLDHNIVSDVIRKQKIESRKFYPFFCSMNRLSTSRNLSLTYASNGCLWCSP